ncbi:MAG: Rieske (2Fe-2S) protein [Candidatus Dormibacteraceae bacterium]
MSLDVGPVSDFGDRRFRIVNAGGREIGVLRWRDRFFAVHNRCPHQKGPLCLGVVSGRLHSRAPGSMELDDENPVIACPWHGWEFDLESGRALWEEGYAAKVVQVRIEDGRVLLEVGKGWSSPER